MVHCNCLPTDITTRHPLSSLCSFRLFFPGKESSGHAHGEDPLEGSSRCLPCREGCPYCRDDTPCLAQEDGALRLSVASFQGLCMLLDLVAMVLVYHFRRNKVRAHWERQGSGVRGQAGHYRGTTSRFWSVMSL